MTERFSKIFVDILNQELRVNVDISSSLLGICSVTYQCDGNPDRLRNGMSGDKKLSIITHW
jgi:hypothetical protein